MKIPYVIDNQAHRLADILDGLLKNEFRVGRPEFQGRDTKLTEAGRRQKRRGVKASKQK